MNNIHMKISRFTVILFQTKISIDCNNRLYYEHLLGKFHGTVAAFGYACLIIYILLDIVIY